MALQSRINEIYPNRSPFMESLDGKRKSANKDLRVQALLAQEAAKRQCIDGVLPQEQQPPAQDFLQRQDDANQAAPTDFSGFYHQLQQEKQQHRNVTGILQQPAAQQQQGQHGPIDETVPQHYDEGDIGLCRYGQQEQPCSSHDDFRAAAEDLQQQFLQQHSQQQQQHSAVPTLEQLLHEHDLNSRHKPPDRELKQMMSLDRVFGADTSRDGFIRDGTAAAAAGPSTRSNSSAAATAAAAAAAAAREQQSWHLTGLPYIPWDWSVRSSVRLSSAQPFNVLEDEMQEGGLGGWCQAVAAAGGAAATAATAPSKQERLQQALMQWQHPANALPPALLAAPPSGTNGTSAAAAAAAVPAAGPAAAAAAATAAAGGAAVATDPTVLLLRERVHQWREALRAAYLLLRHGHCPVIYVCGQAFKQPFTAVLCAPGVMGPSSNSSRNSCTALLSRSNRQLRAHLAAYGCEGLVAGQLEQQHAAAAGQQQGQRQQQLQQQHLPAGAFDGQPGSQLLLLGSLQVHSLYAALLALPWCEPAQPDVPLLCAPVHFLHAQLCPLRLVALPDALLDQQQQQQQRQAAGGAVDAAAGHQPLHYMELRASSSSSSIMPWTLHRLHQLMHDTQGLEGFQVYLGTEPCSSSLNVLPELWTAAAAAVAAGVDGSSAPPAGGQDASEQQQQQEWQRCGRGFSAAEASCWRGSVGLLHGRVLRQLRVEDGSIAAKLA